MTTKASQKANGKSVSIMDVHKEVTANANKTAKKEAKKPTVDQLEKQVKELTAKLEAVPKNLNERIEYFNNKKDLIRKLTKLQANAENLQTHIDQLAELAASDDFQTDDYILSIESGTKYSKNQVFAIQNPVLVADVLVYLLGQIEAKAEALKKEIAA